MNTTDLILKYKATNDPKIGQQLLELHAPIINQHVQKWSGTIPDIVIRKYADQYALDGFRTYDPSKAQIQTHLYNHLSRLSRLNYANQNVVQIPEHQIRQISSFNQSINHLRDTLDREPTQEEIADHMGIPVSHVAKLAKNIRKEFSFDSNFEGYSTGQLLGINGISDSIKLNLHDTLNRMAPEDRAKFNDITGFEGTKPLTPKQFGSKYGMKPYEVSRFKSNLARQLSKVNGEE